jgi:hypothetical protein
MLHGGASVREAGIPPSSERSDRVRGVSVREPGIPASSERSNAAC